ncbi:T-cell immunomodulatory protein [Blomia tropicalis]|nr:T-cell immunomodulatory protein [Blomia tropicalis]
MPRFKLCLVSHFYLQTTIIWSIVCLLQSTNVFINCLKEETLVSTHTNGLISAFGDFNSDRFTDVFIISENGKSFYLLKSYENEPELRTWPNLKCVFNHSEESITAIIPGDFNGDAMMDVMTITQIGDSNQLNVWIFKGDRISLDCDTSNKKPLITNAKSQPLVLDFNGDMIIDFLVETETCSRELWMYVNKQFVFECRDDLKPPIGNGAMLNPNSNAFVNLQNCKDGTIDLNTDIFISGQQGMEYWFNDRGFSQTNFKTIRYPDQERYIIGQSSFADFNIDGCIEHIIVVCEKRNRAYCEPNILWYNYVNNEWTSISDLSDATNQTTLYFEPIRTTFGVELPISVRVGDVDGDGFLDLITVMRSVNDVKTRAVILQNVKDHKNELGRKFKLFWVSDALISDNIELVSFLDVLENGKLDLIMTTRNASNHYNVIWMRNIFMESSCFLKVLVTTGLCLGPCPNDKVPYGTNYAGPFVCYETFDIDGHLIKGCSTQLSQSSYFALQMPYSVFGLGEAPNFVENVIASVPSGDVASVRKSKWTQIVPDAQIVLIPYPPNETIYWICKLFYTPSSIVFSTLATLAVLCGVLIIIILILHRKEVMEDISENEEYKRYWPESR